MMLEAKFHGTAVSSHRRRGMKVTGGQGEIKGGLAVTGEGGGALSHKKGLLFNDTIINIDFRNKDANNSNSLILINGGSINGNPSRNSSSDRCIACVEYSDDFRSAYI
jgi:hypothetical protein